MSANPDCPSCTALTLTLREAEQQRDAAEADAVTLKADFVGADNYGKKLEAKLRSAEQAREAAELQAKAEEVAKLDASLKERHTRGVLTAMENDLRAKLAEAERTVMAQAERLNYLAAVEAERDDTGHD